MFITVVCASLYMWYKKIEHFPWGMKEVRPLLVARGLTGFFGVFGMYCKYSATPAGLYVDTVTYIKLLFVVCV